MYTYTVTVFGQLEVVIEQFDAQRSLEIPSSQFPEDTTTMTTLDCADG